MRWRDKLNQKTWKRRTAYLYCIWTASSVPYGDNSQPRETSTPAKNRLDAKKDINAVPGSNYYSSIGYIWSLNLGNINKVKKKRCNLEDRGHLQGRVKWETEALSIILLVQLSSPDRLRVKVFQIFGLHIFCCFPLNYEREENKLVVRMLWKRRQLWEERFGMTIIWK